MSTRSPEPTLGTSSTTRPRHKPVGSLFTSPYAISQQPEGRLGDYGAVLLKPMTLTVGGWRQGEELEVGTVVPAEVTSKWPLANRMAMEKNGFVTFFHTPAEAEDAMRDVAATQAEVQANPLRARIKAQEANGVHQRMARMRQAKADRRAAAERAAVAARFA